MIHSNYLFLTGAAVVASLATVGAWTCYCSIRNHFCKDSQLRHKHTPQEEARAHSVLFIPPKFDNSHDTDLCLSVMRDHSFATLISVSPGDDPMIHTTTIPMVLKQREEEKTYYLEFHLAIGNVHGKVLEQYGNCTSCNGGEQQQWRHLVIFNGPHGYISPTLYPEEDQTKSVPTWNYVQVQVESRSVRRLSDERLVKSVAE